MATPPKYPPTAAPIADPKNGFLVDRTWLLFLQGLASQAAAAGTGTVTHTGTLTAEHLLLGNGGADIKALGAVGTSTTVLHGNAAGAPTFSAVDLAADVTGDLPFANLTPATAANRLLGRGSASGAGDFQEITLGAGLTMTGTSLSASGGAGTVTTTGSPASGNLTKFSGATSITNGDLSGDVTTSGTLATTLANTAVTPSTYGDATHVGQFTVDSKGRITAASSVAITGGGSGALTLLEQHTASTSASLNFTTAITSTYDDYWIEIIDLVPATSGVSLYMRVSTNGGSSYDSGGNYATATSRWSSVGFGNQGSGTDTKIDFTAGATCVNTAAVGGYSGSAYFRDPLNAATHKTVTGQGTYTTTTPAIVGTIIAGRYTSTTAVNAFQFLFSAGNIASGTIRVYGLSK